MIDPKKILKHEWFKIQKFFWRNKALCLVILIALFFLTLNALKTEAHPTSGANVPPPYEFLSNKTVGCETDDALISALGTFDTWDVEVPEQCSSLPYGQPSYGEPEYWVSLDVGPVFSHVLLGKMWYIDSDMEVQGPYWVGLEGHAIESH
jgi:hypothetical protein